MDVFPILASAFGLVGFAGGAVGFFAKGRGDAIIAYQTKEISLLKDDNARLEKQDAAKSARIASLEGENATLKQLAQGSPKLTELTEQIRRLVEVVSRKGAK